MSVMTHWNEVRAFSIYHDCEMARLSGFDDRSQEHWIMMPTGKLDGLTYRERRELAIEHIQDWIEAGNPCGKVEGFVTTKRG